MSERRTEVLLERQGPAQPQGSAQRQGRPRQGLLQRSGLLHEVAKFGAVGIVGYALDTLLANFFHFGLGWGPIVSKTLSTAIAAVVTYVGNRHWSFKHRAGDGGTREYVTFGVLTVIGLLITLAFVGIGHYVIRLQGALAFNLFANVLGTGAATVFRFWAYRRYVFNATAPASGRPALQVPVAFREAA